jgi:hypothetical protein
MARSTSTALVILILILTFPVWIGLAGGLFGLVFGLLGAFIGIIGAIFGAIVGVFGAVLGALFGVFDWGWSGYSFPVISISKSVLIIAIIFLIVLLTRKNRVKK